MIVQKDVLWARTPSKFRDTIPSEQYPAEKDRYALYVNFCCPWCHRTMIAMGLKELGDVVQMIEADSQDITHGWWFSGRRGPERDPVYGVKYMKELYFKADPGYNGRITLPVLWDKKTHTIVNNESSDILRILITSFDAFLPAPNREANKGPSALIPTHLKDQISIFNTWVYENVNNGVYKTGFATSQLSYDSNITKLFASLDRLEAHLAEPGHQPYLFGEFITEADIRLYTTLIRFDVVYYTLFKCNVKMIRADYPRLHGWLRRLYWGEGNEEQNGGGVFAKTTLFEAIKRGYATAVVGNGLVPKGPLPHIMPLD